MITPLVLLHTLSLISLSECLCGASIRWSHRLNIENVYGMWYGVGYAKHTPDMTDRPEDIGCVTLYISDADNIKADWRDWTLPRNNYNYDNRWSSYKNNPWSDTPMSGSWPDTRIRFKRGSERNASFVREKRDLDTFQDREHEKRDKRDMYGERRLKVIWDQDGQSMEQTYVYSKEEPGLWTVEKWRPMEREMMSHGVDLWYPDNPPRHPEVIRILKLSADQLIINHCSDSGGGGVFSLILRRSPRKVGYWEWYELQKQFYDFELPNVHRKAAVCAGCLPVFSEIVFVVCGIVWKLL